MENKKIDFNKKKIVPICLSIMLILTFLSKVMDSFTVAKVSVTNPIRKTLSKEVSGEGKFETNQKSSVKPMEGVEVAQVNVSVKDVINSENVLFTYSMDSLNELLENKKTALRKKEIDYEITKINGIADKEMTNEFLANQQVEKANANLEKADEKKQQAKQEYEDKLSDLKEDYNSNIQKLVEDAEKEISKYNEKMNDEINALDKADENYEANKSEIEKKYNEKISEVKSQLKTAKEKLKTEYKESKGSVTFDEESYDSEIETALNQVDDANTELENAKINDANNSANKAKNAQVTNLNLESMQLDIDEIKKEINEIEELIASEGKVYSNTEGIVMEITDSNEILIGEEELIFRATIDVDDTKYVTEDSEVDVSYGANYKTTGIVKSIDYKDEEVSLEIELAENIQNKMLNTSGYFSILTDCGEYQYCIPVEAVKSGPTDYFCYVVEEKNTVLGKEYVTKVSEFKVELINDEYAAVKGDLSEVDRVVFSSNKTINENDRIRIMD